MKPCGPWPLSTGSVGVVQKFGEYQGVQEPGCSCDLDVLDFGKGGDEDQDRSMVKSGLVLMDF